MKIKALFIISVIAIRPTYAMAHEQSTLENEELHFEHPLVTESPSPDTKLRFDYIYRNKPGEDAEPKSKETTLRVEGEYAFNRSLSIEVDVPYTWRDPAGEPSTRNLDNVNVGLKYANYAFEDKGLLLGGGIEAGLPTGDTRKGIGSNHVFEVAPFLDFGYERGQVQFVGFAEFAFPTNKNGEDVANFEFGWNLALVYSGFGNVMPVVELDGESVNGGEEDGTNVVNLTPGVKYQWPGVEALQIGAGVSVPVTNDKEFHASPIVSVFYHF